MEKRIWNILNLLEDAATFGEGNRTDEEINEYVEKWFDFNSFTLPENNRDFFKDLMKERIKETQNKATGKQNTVAA